MTPETTTVPGWAAALPPASRVPPCACAVALAATLWWSHSCRPRPAPSGGDCCNDPRCLRCHASSQRHRQSFRANAQMLRRLAKLEPGLFEGMRQDIWSAIEDMERTFELEKTRPQPELFIRLRLRRLMQECWRRWQERSSDATMKAIGARTTGTLAARAATPFSPQPGQNPSVFLLPGLEALPWHCANQCHDKCPCMRLWRITPPSKKSPPIAVTGDVEALQKSYPVIRRELLDVLLRHQHSSNPFTPFDPTVYTAATDQSNERGNKEPPEWSSIYLYHQGRRQVETCNTYFPRTTQILETQCPHLMAGKCGLGSVYISKLENNTKVKEHCGPTNVRWRCHLPLVVPNSTQSCLRVGVPGVNERRSGWAEGVPLLFDDSFRHSAVHHGAAQADDDESGIAKAERRGARVVLIVDFWHPALSEADRTALGVLYPPGS